MSLRHAARLLALSVDLPGWLSRTVRRPWGYAMPSALVWRHRASHGSEMEHRRVLVDLGLGRIYGVGDEPRDVGVGTVATSTSTCRTDDSPSASQRPSPRTSPIQKDCPDTLDCSMRWLPTPPGAGAPPAAACAGQPSERSSRSALGVPGSWDIPGVSASAGFAHRNCSPKSVVWRALRARHRDTTSRSR